MYTLLQCKKKVLVSFTSYSISAWNFKVVYNDFILFKVDAGVANIYINDNINTFDIRIQFLFLHCNLNLVKEETKDKQLEEKLAFAGIQKKNQSESGKTSSDTERGHWGRYDDEASDTDRFLDSFRTGLKILYYTLKVTENNLACCMLRDSAMLILLATSII